jgi:transposase
MYPTDFSDVEWTRLRSYLPVPKAKERPRTHQHAIFCGRLRPSARLQYLFRSVLTGAEGKEAVLLTRT